MDDVRLHCGDSLDFLKTLEAGSVDAVITSPPYAMQRAGAYPGIPDADYPWWTAKWFAHLRAALKPEGSVLVNIRENLKGGEISDYVHKTRLVLRMFDWIEAEELIWAKSCSPPFGSLHRPRRAWERLLWFSLSKNPFCDSLANGKPSSRIGISRAKPSRFHNKGVVDTKLRDGTARCTDVCFTPTDNSEYDHPAKYPAALAEWCIKMICPTGGVVLDPFMGSGSTGVACVQTGRRFIGCEIIPEYFAIAQKRIAEAKGDFSLFAEVHA